MKTGHYNGFFFVFVVLDMLKRVAILVATGFYGMIQPSIIGGSCFFCHVQTYGDIVFRHDVWLT